MSPRLRVCAVAVAIPAEGGPSSSAPQPGHRYHRRDCGGWVSLGSGDEAARLDVQARYRADAIHLELEQLYRDALPRAGARHPAS